MESTVKEYGTDEDEIEGTTRRYCACVGRVNCFGESDFKPDLVQGIRFHFNVILLLIHPGIHISMAFNSNFTS